MTALRTLPIACIVCVAGMFAGYADARADECDLGSDAVIAQAKVPHAITNSMMVKGQPPVTTEMIFTGDKAYRQVNGAWQVTPYSARQQIDLLTAAKVQAAQTPHTCQKRTGETVNGEVATLLMRHTESDGKATDAWIWISDGSGLPLKFEMHLSNGTVVTDAFRYVSIQAPPGTN